jgi:hypothetical protein
MVVCYCGTCRKQCALIADLSSIKLACCSFSGGPELLSLRTRSPGVARQLPSFLAPQEKKAKEGAEQQRPTHLWRIRHRFTQA